MGEGDLGAHCAQPDEVERVGAQHRETGGVETRELDTLRCRDPPAAIDALRSGHPQSSATGVGAHPHSRSRLRRVAGRDHGE